MALSKNEIAIIQNIQGRLRHGDIKAISETTNFTREYVGKVLNTTNDFYNEEIIDAAIKIITKRERNNERKLETLTS